MTTTGPVAVSPPTAHGPGQPPPGGEPATSGTAAGQPATAAPARAVSLLPRALRPARRTSAPTRTRARTPLWRWAIRLASLAAFVGLWQVLTSQHVDAWVRFDNLPTVTDIASAFGHQLGTGDYWHDLWSSLVRILVGFVIAAVLGVALGVAVARTRVANDIVGPVLELLRPIPAIALVPVAIMLFPGNEEGIIFITTVAAFFPILVSTRHAVRALPTIWEEAVRTLGGGRRHVLFRVVLPGALPGVFGGLSVGMGVAWICVISAEMISGQYGVGYRTWQAYTVVDYPSVFVGMITIGLAGGLTSAAVELLGRRATRWLPRTQEVGR